MGTPSNQAQAAYSPGDVFARRYVIEHILGAGFQAEVYAVKNKHTGAARALKLLKARHQSNAEYVQRFLQEAEQLTNLSHHNLVRVFDAGIEDTGEVWMLMELLEGRSLRKCMQELGSASVPLSLFIVREVARAIALAHEQDVMHRDVKPENIMVTPDGVKVLDFGIAKVYGSAVPTTDRKMRTLGTIAYMAPEQVASLPPTLSVDVYALGIVLYELLAGAHPFADVLHDALEVGKRQMFHTPPMISTRIIGVPETVETILNGALEKNRAHRTSMATFAEQLEQELKRFERDAERGAIAWHPRPAEASYFESLMPKSSLRAEAPRTFDTPSAPPDEPEEGDEPGPHGTVVLTPSPHAGVHPTPRPARGTIKMETPTDLRPPSAPPPHAAGGPRPELSGVLKEVVARQAQASRPLLTPVPPEPSPARAARAEAITIDAPVVTAPAVAHAVTSASSSTVSVRSLVSVLAVGVPLTVLATWAWLDQSAARSRSSASADESASEPTSEPDSATAASSATAEPPDAAPSASSDATPSPGASDVALEEPGAAPTSAPPAAAGTPKPKATWTKPAKPTSPPPKSTGTKPSGRVF